MRNKENQKRIEESKEWEKEKNRTENWPESPRGSSPIVSLRQCYRNDKEKQKEKTNMEVDEGSSPLDSSSWN